MYTYGGLYFEKTGAQVVEKMNLKLGGARDAAAVVEKEFTDLCDRYRIAVEAATPIMEEMLNRRPKYLEMAMAAPGAAPTGSADTITRGLRERDKDDLFEVYQRLDAARREAEQYRAIIDNLAPEPKYRLQLAELIDLGF